MLLNNKYSITYINIIQISIYTKLLYLLLFIYFLFLLLWALQKKALHNHNMLIYLLKC